MTNGSMELAIIHWIQWLNFWEPEEIIPDEMEAVMGKDKDKDKKDKDEK